MLQKLFPNLFILWSQVFDFTSDKAIDDYLHYMGETHCLESN